MNDILRQHAEQQTAEELHELKQQETHPVPDNWQLSPQSVVTYLIGGELKNGFTIKPKYIGNRRLMEIAVATLATDRALLLYGLPGTAKSWVSEHIAAAISGDSTLVVQGTAGTGEEAIRYGWNYAELLAKGPSEQALVETPVMRAMRQGKLARVEELTRIGADVQDTLITILSEKTLPVPELNSEIQAVRGFNQNTMKLPAEKPALEEIRRIVTIFRELRAGLTADKKTKLKSPSGTLSTAEAISVVNNGMALSGYFGDGALKADDLIAGILGAVVKDPVQDKIVWQEYLDTVVKQRDGWQDLYRAARDMA